MRANSLIRTLRDEAVQRRLCYESFRQSNLRLSPADRARLLDRLIASLDADAGAETAWDELAETRGQELRTGAVQTIPIEIAAARPEARFPG
ncbi:MAG: addiction module protein [Metallibacterium sp.]